ncbi:hypothetical protein TNCT_251691 [Trichonephila clavata]|uniref:Uncharacterized protein n=1 Tax=Trichonephila clavata TaxID=2740835 RepID=A0A8X6L1I5_TRICU|nr:hypothetical protein TNCT_251691 [Trichonephila clavata]
MGRATVAIKHFTATRDGYKRILDTLEKDGNHNVDDPPSLYAKIQREHDEISTLLDNVVSGFGSIPRCTTIGCPVHSSDANTPTQSPRIIQPGSPKSNTKRINDRFITPPASRYSWLHTSQP